MSHTDQVFKILKLTSNNKNYYVIEIIHLMIVTDLEKSFKVIFWEFLFLTLYPFYKFICINMHTLY